MNPFRRLFSLLFSPARPREFSLPENLPEILEDEGYWESESYPPLWLSVEEVQWQGKDVRSYQVAFEVPVAGRTLDGDAWESEIRAHVRKAAPALEKRVKGDSESAACVLWVDNPEDFVALVRYVQACIA